MLVRGVANFITVIEEYVTLTSRMILHNAFVLTNLYYLACRLCLLGERAGEHAGDSEDSCWFFSSRRKGCSLLIDCRRSSFFRRIRKLQLRRLGECSDLGKF